MKALLLFMALIASTSCSSNNFANYNQLGDLRVLTLVANTPEVNPGASVTITPVISDLNGGGRTLNYSVVACVDPGIGVGVTPACSSPDASNTQSGTVTPAAGASATYTGSVSSFSVTVPSSTEMFASATSAEQYNGVAYLVFYTLSAPDGSASVDSFTRITVSETSKTAKNNNPVITEVDQNDSASPSLFSILTATASFRVISPASSSESYTLMLPDGSLEPETESLVNTWFISDGSFEYERTDGSDEDSYYPSATRPSGRGEVIGVVTRDGRGGAAFQKLEMN